MIIKVCVMSMLVICAITDVVCKKVSMKVLLIFGVIGILLESILKSQHWTSVLGGICIGFVLIGFGWITREAIGLGDGAVIAATGLYLGFRNNFILLFGGLLLAALFSVILLILRKAHRHTTIPFIPFLLITYAGMLLMSSAVVLP